MDILLTGASGFVGRHLAFALSREHRVFPLNKRPTGSVREIVHDFAQPLTSEKLPDRIDAVIHAAGLVGHHANSSALCRRVNVTATSDLADYAVRAGAKRFLLFSTGGVYRPTEERLTEMSALDPRDDYTQSKLDAEISAEKIKGDLALQILRLFFPFGPTQRGRLIPNLIERVAKDEPISLSNAVGEPLVTPLYIDDLIEYVRRVLIVPNSFIANLAGDEVVSILSLGNMIARALNRAARFEVSEGTPICNWVGNNDLISRLTGYSPRASLELGLKLTIAEMQA
jgi:UDP-glucose 4-epimerase